MKRLYISMYHYVRDLKNSRYPEIKGLDISLFKKQVEFIKDSFSPVTIEDVIEPYLMQIGFLNRTPRGRCITKAACLHLGYDLPDAQDGQLKIEVLQ